MKTAIFAALVAFAPAAALAHDNPAPAKPAREVVKPQAPTKPVKKPEHSGGTDAYGCHTNHATGDYHCHNPK